jgi:hypothetical protein
MSADNFHHQVEKSLNKAGKVYDFNDFVLCVQEANGGKVNVQEMKVGDFYEWVDASSTYKLNRTVPRPYLSDMVLVKAIRGSRNLKYKAEFNGQDNILNFLKAGAAKTGIQKPMSRTVARGIPQIKKDDILSKLGELMPPSRRKFWQELPVANVADLVENE